MVKLLGWLKAHWGVVAPKDAYLFRWIRQVCRQLWSFGRDQFVGLILTILIFLYQLKSGLIGAGEVRTTEVATIAYPYLSLLALYLLFEILRAPFVLDRKRQTQIDQIQGELNAHREKDKEAQAGSPLALFLDPNRIAQENQTRALREQAEALRQNTAEIRAAQTQKRLSETARQVMDMNRAYARAQAFKLTGFSKRGKELYEMKLTQNEYFESWELTVKGCCREVIASLNDAEAADFDAPIASEARVDSQALNRIHSDMRGQILVWLKRLSEIRGRYAT